MSTQHIVYFLHAEGENYCKVGETTLTGLPRRVSEFKRGKDTPVTSIGYQLCDSKEKAIELERTLLENFNRVENPKIPDKELLRIDSDLVIYIQEKCNTDSVAIEYLKSLIPIPDYDDIDPEVKLKMQKHDETILAAKMNVQSAAEKYTEAKQTLETAEQALKAAERTQQTAESKKTDYLDSIAQELWSKHWEIKKIAELTGLSETRIKNLVYERKRMKLEFH